MSTEAETETESTAERMARLETELLALRSRKPDALRGRIMALLACGQYLDSERESECVRDALIGYAAAVTKAVAVADAGAEHLSCNTGAEVAFTSDDVTAALLGLSAFLEVAPELLRSVEHADERAMVAAARNGAEVQP